MRGRALRKSCQTRFGHVQSCASRRQLATVEELQLLVRTFLQPGVLSAARPQALANVIWALGELCRLAGWQGGVSEQDVQQLLGKQQLADRK